MSKQVTFNDNDEELIRKISEYQEAHGLPYFVSAVRKLCDDALKIKEIGQ